MKQMRILFEAGPMVDKKKTGVGYYVDHLISSLATGNSMSLDGYYFDFFHRNHTVTPVLPSTNFHCISLIPGKVLSASRRLGWQPPLELFVRGSYDIVLFTNYVALPILKKKQKTALVIYDLSYLDHPEFTQEKNLTYLRTFFSPSINHADIIITISEFTKKRISQLFPEATKHIVVTPIPPVPLEKIPDEQIEAILSRYKIEKNQYLLYLGTIEPRKNIQNLIEAYVLLPEEIRNHYPLVLAGGRGWKDESIRSTIKKYQSLGYRIITTGYVTEEQKYSLYHNTACFILPSHYEGFGMPVLEAMQHHIPVAVSNIPVFHEVAGNAAAYFDKDNIQDIANVVTSVLQDADLRKTIIAQQQAELDKYTWEQNNTVVIEAFQSIRR